MKLNFDHNKIYKIGFCCVLLIGLLLRFYWHFMCRSLWEDEAHIALNFIHFGYLGLMKPLENFQSAPIFFLWSVETFSKIFGNGELSLRAFPFLLSVLTLPVFYFLVKELTKDRLTALIAFFIFSINWSFIYYSSEVKSYTIDVSAYIILTYVLVSGHPKIVKLRKELLGLTGVLFAFYSNVSFVILVCSAIFMVSNWKFSGSDKHNYEIGIPKSDLRIFGAWAAAFLINFFVFIYHHPYSIGMQEIWSWTFCPMNIFSCEFVDFLNYRARDTIFSGMLFFEDSTFFAYVIVAVIIAAFIKIVRSKQYYLLLFTLLPICIHLVLSMFKLYPFYFRFILYLLPPFIILFAFGIAAIVNFIQQKSTTLLAIPVCVLILYFSIAKSVHKYAIVDREIKPVLDFINQNYQGAPLIITTPWTLYNYYKEEGYIKNTTGKAIEWNLKAEDYFNSEIIQLQRKPYILLYSVGGNADGYTEVLNNLKINGLISRRFEYKTYGVIEVQPFFK